MASHEHEGVVGMFRHRPDLAVEVLTGLLKVDLPDHLATRLGDAEVVELRPAAHRADAVVVLDDGAGPVAAVVIEVQRRRDGDKPWVWPEYVTGVRRQLRCPTVLLVVCTDTATARWASAPLELDECGSQVLPRVLGPDLVPVLTDPVKAAQEPEIAVLSALTHVRADGPFEVLDALHIALDHVERRQAVEYAALVLNMLRGAARAHLEELMETGWLTYESDFTRRLESRGEARGEARGRAHGEAAMLLRILATRGVAVSADARERITACTDLEQLEAWGERAATARTVEELFG